ncbi:MAG: hypothetical protein KIG59_04075, partial [Muribaculaceae bacterium]|nr:hypothetical protein [Muribaculaceae bacterium]
RTEHDAWGILRFLPGHMVQVTLPMVVAGIEVAVLGGWIVSTIVRLGCRVSWLRALSQKDSISPESLGVLLQKTPNAAKMCHSLSFFLQIREQFLRILSLKQTR